jgi:hypothetical protein
LPKIILALVSSRCDQNDAARLLSVLGFCFEQPFAERKATIFRGAKWNQRGQSPTIRYCMSKVGIETLVQAMSA